MNQGERWAPRNWNCQTYFQFEANSRCSEETARERQFIRKKLIHVNFSERLIYSHESIALEMVERKSNLSEKPTIASVSGKVGCGGRENTRR